MKRKRVLVAPLDWGLGHATRCIPIIETLLKKDCDVLLAGSGHSLELLKKQFPQLSFFDLPGYEPRYASGNFMALAMLSQLPKFIRVINTEHRRVQRIISDQHVDAVISDNRFGCWSANAKSVFITHQLSILTSLSLRVVGMIINYFNRRQIQKFNACWVPDFDTNRLSGILTATYLPVQYIGPLSRFKNPSERTAVYDILILLSGPEPQRTALETIMISLFEKSALKILLVRGVSGTDAREISRSFTIVDFLSREDLQQAIEVASFVVCRSGYSTIMDLARLKKSAFFIPTPGQTEQEYLAQRLKKMGIADYAKQNKVTADGILRSSKQYTGFTDISFDEQLLNRAIDKMLN